MHSEFLPMAEKTNPIRCPSDPSTGNFDLLPFFHLGEGVTLAVCLLFEHDNNEGFVVDHGDDGWL